MVLLLCTALDFHLGTVEIDADGLLGTVDLGQDFQPANREHFKGRTEFFGTFHLVGDCSTEVYGLLHILPNQCC